MECGEDLFIHSRATLLPWQGAGGLTLTAGVTHCGEYSNYLDLHSRPSLLTALAIFLYLEHDNRHHQLQMRNPSLELTFHYIIWSLQPYIEF